jgi:aminopeptidase N
MPISATGEYGNASDNLTITSFFPSPKMSSYLLAWCVGEFEFISGCCYGGKLPVNVYTTSGKVGNAYFALKVCYI